MKLNKQFVDGMLDVKEKAESLTLKDLVSAINYSKDKEGEETYEFKMGLSIATLDTREVLYNTEDKTVVRLFDPHFNEGYEVDTMSLLLPVQKEMLNFCLPTVSTIMANPETLVTFNKPYFIDGELRLIFVVYLNSKEIGTFMSHINTNSMIFRKNFSKDDFTEMDKESKLFIESIK